MANQGYTLLCLLVNFLNFLTRTEFDIFGHCNSPVTLSRRSFPKDFIFGTSSSAYQYEGATNEDGRGPSIWDIFAHDFSDRIADGSNGDVAEEFYHRYEDDVKVMKNLGFDAFRFSISWTRVLPSGKLSGGVNLKGINYYNNLINELLSNGLEPFVTLLQFDPPQALEDEYGGFRTVRDGVPIGPVAASSWLYVYPRGIQDVLLYLKSEYNNPLVYITENGMDDYNNETLPLQKALNDSMRIDYYHRHLWFLYKAIGDGANVKGYFAWSFLDNYEWGSGYTVRFGINFVDYSDGLKRYLKNSAKWFQNFLHT
ncbi:Glycoside hydrolase family 1 [Dillenia turbinata]|uniref:Glycoside hydrolase family 1 n=1 Tax=Dillenia turbinata TaxID=194707 RepID=A0AAN8VEZ4_9MAGN